MLWRGELIHREKEIPGMSRPTCAMICDTARF